MEDHVEEFTELLHHLQQVVEKGKTIPLIKQEIVDAESLRQIVAKLRGALPEAVVAASKVVNRREEILREAEAERKRLVDNSEIVREAHAEQARTLKQTEAKVLAMLAEARQKAEQAAEEIRRDADRYAQKSKEKVFNYALDLLKSVHESISESTENLSEVRNRLQASSQIIEEWMAKILQEKEKA